MSGSSPLTRGKHPLHVGMGVCIRLIPAHAGKTRKRRRAAWVTAAHPRSRGENDRPHGAVYATTGSSPLTRGKHARANLNSSQRGLIPAHAGKTTSRPSPTRPTSAHPRSRGENPSSTTASGTGSGSSPLTRGKHARANLNSSQRGLIPAHAGKTTSRPSPTRPTSAHPRSRGENPSSTTASGTGSGSSPLTRGKLG